MARMISRCLVYGPNTCTFLIVSHHLSCSRSHTHTHTHTHIHNGILCFSLASVSNLGRVHERSCDEAVQEHKNTLGDAQETSPASCGGRCVSCQVSRVFTTSHRRAQHCTNQSLYHYRLHHHQLCRGLQLLAFVQARFTQKERSLSDRLPTTNNQQH
jgi:hypothetical protein